MVAPKINKKKLEPGRLLLHHGEGRCRSPAAVLGSALFLPAAAPPATLVLPPGAATVAGAAAAARVPMAGGGGDYGLGRAAGVGKLRQGFAEGGCVTVGKAGTKKKGRSVLTSSL